MLLDIAGRIFDNFISELKRYKDEGDFCAPHFKRQY
jgi:hypothetical protein